ncbi:hypothetical protein ACIQAC_09015 [Streptomyces sp. NPDC088387]|uniref:hypothetical protein n=1 Tax=Streptomyces sp. NPDC088387 TaxID=3365859 RepID=UPI00380F48EF
MSAPHPPRARSGGDLRILRAAVFAAVCVVLSAAGHALASCAAVPLWALGAGFAGVLAVAAPLAGRERSLAGIVTLLAAGQAVLHTLFGLGQHGMAATTTGTAAASATSADASLVERAARLVCGSAAATLSPAEAHRILTDARLAPDGMTAAGHHPADAMSATAGSSAALLPSLPMLLGHVLAALAAGWLLRRGDLALLRLVELSAHGVAEGASVRSLRAALALVRALRAGLPGAPRAGSCAVRADRCTPPEPRSTALRHSVIRRGPPPAVFDLAA